MRTLRRLLAAGTLAFLAAVAVLSLRDSGGERAQPQPIRRAAAAVLPGMSTDARIAARQAAVRAAPRDPDGYTLLAQEYMQKVRETGDAAFYRRADLTIGKALGLAPHDPGALTERAALKLARHDFAGGLADARAAHRLAPYVVRPYGAMVDGLVELGRYRSAERVLQKMVDLKPDLASLSRVSYVRELHGDLTGAVSAMRAAASAGGGTAENTAYVDALLGNLELARGRLSAAERAYRDGLERFPSYAPARAGLARVLAAQGRTGAAIKTLRRVVRVLPLPEHVIALGELELATGRRAAARRDLALVGAEERLLQANGVDVDTELALFEASHGSAARAVTLARAAWENAPSVRSADAMAWALTRAGRPREALPWAARALHLGTRDPLTLFHAGIASRDAGHPELARTRLRRALALNPRFSPLWAPRARRAFDALRAPQALRAPEGRR
jgi:pentatricopeptide repeat protein